MHRLQLDAVPRPWRPHGSCYGRLLATKLRVLGAARNEGALVPARRIGAAARYSGLVARGAAKGMSVRLSAGCAHVGLASRSMGTKTMAISQAGGKCRGQ